jgi:raffinose/stachyose/melibiose transport system substrate-binding protein
MKKLLVYLVSILMVFSLAACSSTTEPAETETTVTDEPMETVSIKLAQGKPEIDAQLKAYAKIYEENTGVVVEIESCGGDSCQLGVQLKSDFAADEMPDIFQIQGIEDYKEWDGMIEDLSGEAWLSDTDVAYSVDGMVVGFPVSIEGWGLAYNADLLALAEIDPATLTNYDAYMAAFEKLDGMKEELGIDSVVSMAAGPGMYWVTADHNFNSLLSNGEEYGSTDLSMRFLEGDVDETILTEYANWVDLLFNYADQTVLTTGDYDAQVGAFANEKAVFCHQGNWIDGNLTEATFNMAFAPHGSRTTDTDGIFVAAPSWYVVNSQSENVQAAKDFLNAFVYTTEGNDYMVNEAGMIPAFKNITLSPSGKLSQSVQEWSKMGKTYSWNQYYFAGDFRSNTLGPIYNLLANDEINVEQYVEQMTQAFMDNAE